MVAAHGGAGASTVALAIAEAAAAQGRPAHLVEATDPTRSGLVAAADVELGVNPSGAWRRGSRGQLTIDRRADGESLAAWPVVPMLQDDGLTVVDLGLPAPDSVRRIAISGCRIVVVCRPTVPGVRLAEQLIDSFTGAITVACVGADKWPGEVTASLGPRLRALRARRAVVIVPSDRRLEVNGPTTSPLPKSVVSAGRSLLGLIDPARPGSVSASAQSAARKKGSKQ